MNMTKTVLVVDDQVGIRLLLEEVITQESYHVELAVNGKEAYEKIVDKQPDLIMLDYRLPIIDGPRLIEMLAEKNYQIPIVMMSGLPDKAREGVKNIDMVCEIVEKPFQLNDIREMVSNILK